MAKWELAVVAGLAALAIFYIGSFTGLLAGTPTTHATRVIDGDTIEIANGEKVRLLGIDTPEKGQYLFSEAKERLERLIGGREILLLADRTERDKYDRLLRYVMLNRTELVNLILVREGLASAYIIPPDDAHEQELLEAEEQARSKGLGIWKYMGVHDVFCVGIYYMRYNAMGDDRDNINDEYVEFRNKCEHAVGMEGWKVEDSSHNSYVFQPFTAAPKKTFKLHSGKGNDTGEDLFWGSARPIWNNEDDRLAAWDAEGQLMLNYTYKGY